MAWTKKYKRSIDCKRSRGFSQKQYCKGRKKSRKLRGGATTSYKVLFYSENGEIEPPEINVDLEDNATLLDLAFHENEQEAYNDDKILMNSKDPLLSQTTGIPPRVIHVYPRGHAVLEVN